MKKVEKEIIKKEIKEYYEAYDGEMFNSKEECEAYESNAKGVAGKKVVEFRVAKTYAYDIFDCTGACSDEEVEIYLPKTAYQLDALNQYLNFIDKNGAVLGEEFIGQYVIVQFSYDRDWYKARTIETIISQLKEKFTNLITPKTEEKTN